MLMRRRAVATLILTAGLMAAIQSVQGQTRILYVDANATGLNDGSSWTHAYRYLQDALADANSSPDAGEIHVAQGTYRPDQGRGVTPMDRAATFHIGCAMTIKGGYAGIGRPDPNCRNAESYPTVLSGDLAGNDGPMDELTLVRWSDPTRCDNATRVLSVETTAWITLEGLTVTGSYQSAGLNADELSTAVNLIDCTFVANAGGGIYQLNGELAASRCRFIGNWSLLGGGGIACYAGRFTIRECTFAGNICSSFGGAFYSPFFAAGSLIENCTFVDNRAAGGGAIALGNCMCVSSWFHDASVKIVGCTLRGNHSGEYGAGGAIFLTEGNVTVQNCTFSGNSSQAQGGALGAWASILNLEQCVFSGNVAASDGGGLFILGPERMRDLTRRDFRLGLSGCTFADNRATNGPTMVCRTDSPEPNATGAVSMSNCIFDGDGNQIQNATKSRVTISYSNVRGGPAGIFDPCEGVIWGEGNIDVDPLFAGPGHWDPNGTPNDANDDFWVDGDYHLKSQAGRWEPKSGSWVMDDVTSPCIDAGDPNSDWSAEPWPNGGRVNMGAYGGTAEASKSLSVIGNPEDLNATPAQGPLRIQLGKGASWAGEPNAYDPNLPGYHVVGDIASLTMRARIDNLPTKLVLAIQTSPGMAPMLENFTFTAPCLRIQGEPFGTAGLACSTRSNSTLLWQDAPTVDPKSYFTFAIVAGEVRITFQPKAIELLRTECTVSWIDWYRR
jgi:hypothetical protein